MTGHPAPAAMAEPVTQRRKDRRERHKVG